MRVKTCKVITVQDWDRAVRDTYGRPYSLQQQSGCRPRGTLQIEIPDEASDFKDATPSSIDEEIRGVSFETWKSRDPEAPFGFRSSSFLQELVWHRSFYPNLQMVANDLHERGKIEAGTYLIDIDW